MTTKQRAKNIRNRIIRVGKQYKLAHIGSCLSCVEILTALFFEVMKPTDKFILSAGHKGLALYSTLVEKGLLKEENIGEMQTHPQKNPKIGIEVSTGSLGHGLSIGAGMALAGKRVYVLLSDGDMEEGSTWEAIHFIGENNLTRVKVIVDCNGWSAYRQRPYYLYNNSIPNWITQMIDGHDMKVIINSFSDCKDYSQSKIVFAKTIKGKGYKLFENKLESHYLPIK